MSYEDFTEMPVWRMAFDLILEIYKVTKGFPSDERFGLISDMRRAANSIAHNIAEGFGRYERRDKTRFYKIAKGSAYEVMSQVYVSHGLAYVDEATSDKLIEPCKQVIGDLNAIIKTLENRRG